MINIFFWQKRPLISKSLKSLLLISGFFTFAGSMFSPIYAIFVKEIGGDITTASSAYAVFWMTAGLLTLFAGKLEDKLKETELAIMVSQFVFGLAYILYYFTDTVSMLYLVQVVLGIGGAIFWPAFHSIYSSHIDGQKSNWQWGFYDSLSYIIPAIAALVGGYLVKLYGFDLIFLIMASLSFLNGIFILLLPRKIL